MIRRVLALLRACHPLPAAAVTGLAGAVATARGAGPGTLALAIGATGAGQLSIGWSNDYLDRADDARADRADKPIVAGEIRAGVVWTSAWAALGVCVGLASSLGPGPFLAMAGAVASAWAYNLGLKRTLLSWIPYAVSFGLAPVFLWLVSGPGDPPPAWIMGGGALLGLAGHLTNVLPDVEPDRVTDVRGLPQRLGPRRSVLLAGGALAGTLALVLAFAVLASPHVLELWLAGVAAILVTAVVVTGLRVPRAAFRVTIAAAAAVVALFLVASVR